MLYLVFLFLSLVFSAHLTCAVNDCNVGEDGEVSPSDLLCGYQIDETKGVYISKNGTCFTWNATPAGCSAIEMIKCPFEQSLRIEYRRAFDHIADVVAEQTFAPIMETLKPQLVHSLAVGSAAGPDVLRTFVERYQSNFANLSPDILMDFIRNGPMEDD